MRYANLILALVLLSGCESMTEPREVPVEPVRFGYWYTDHTQELCTDLFCYSVSARVEVFPDSTCDYLWYAEGIGSGAQWSSITAETCSADLGNAMISIHSMGRVGTVVGDTVMALNFGLYARGTPPEQDPFDTVQWGDLILVRR